MTITTIVPESDEASRTLAVDAPEALIHRLEKELERLIDDRDNFEEEYPILYELYLDLPDGP